MLGTGSFALPILIRAMLVGALALASFIFFYECFRLHKQIEPIKSNVVMNNNETPFYSPFGLNFTIFLLASPIEIEPERIMRVVPMLLCRKRCDNRGWCNHQTGTCVCSSGWRGETCDMADPWPCDHPDGFAVFSRCAGECDETNARCKCGAGTKYPTRELSPSCNEPEIPYHHIFSKVPNDDVVSGRATAWCDWDNAGITPPAKNCLHSCAPGFEDTLDCDIKRNGTYCPNQCNGRGTCDAGFCHCEEQWWGADCSLPRMPVSMGYTRRRARPLVYVYELASEFNSGVHQRRFRDFECVPRTYESSQETASSWYYGLETSFHEYLMRSPHRTTDPTEADFFFAPVNSACFHLRYNTPTARHWAWKLPPPNNRPHGTWLFWSELANYLDKRVADPAIVGARQGMHDYSDHIFVTPYDEGACYLPKKIGNAIFITHWGNTGRKHFGSTTGFANDNWNTLADKSGPLGDVLGGWRCYDPMKDIVVPPWNRMKHTEPATWLLGRRSHLFFFSGDLGSPDGIPNSGPHGSPAYSMGIRQRVTATLRDRRDEGFFIAGRIHDYEVQLAKSTFCGVFPGDGWSGGIITYVRHGCIPVIIQDGVNMPFELVGPGSKNGDVQ